MVLGNEEKLKNLEENIAKCLTRVKIENKPKKGRHIHTSENKGSFSASKGLHTEGVKSSTRLEKHTGTDIFFLKPQLPKYQTQHCENQR